MPQISVIVPVYKVEPYLCRCVDSILGQTYADFELILVDDGSPDNCPAICDEYAAKDSRVVVIHQENSGLSAARNVGLKWAKEKSDSEWISFVDSDDWIHASFLQNLLYAALLYKTKISCCNHQIIHDGEEVKAIDKCEAKLCNPEDIYCAKNNNGIDAYPCRYLYHKSLFDDVEYPRGKIFEDLFTTHKLLFKTNFISAIEQPLYYYFQRDDSIVHLKWTHKRLDRLEAYELLIQYFEKSDRNRVKWCAKRGYVFAIYANYLQVLESDLCEREKRKITKNLRKKMRSFLRRYAQGVGIFFATENYLYAIAWPRLVALYWHMRSIQGKLCRNN